MWPNVVNFIELLRQNNTQKIKPMLKHILTFYLQCSGETHSGEKRHVDTEKKAEIHTAKLLSPSLVILIWCCCWRQTTKICECELMAFVAYVFGWFIKTVIGYIWLCVSHQIQPRCLCVFVECVSLVANKKKHAAVYQFVGQYLRIEHTRRRLEIEICLVCWERRAQQKKKNRLNVVW